MNNNMGQLLFSANGKEYLQGRAVSTIINCAVGLVIMVFGFLVAIPFLTVVLCVLGIAIIVGEFVQRNFIGKTQIHIYENGIAGTGVGPKYGASLKDTTTLRYFQLSYDSASHADIVSRRYLIISSSGSQYLIGVPNPYEIITRINDEKQNAADRKQKAKDEAAKKAREEAAKKAKIEADKRAEEEARLQRLEEEAKSGNEKAQYDLVVFHIKQGKIGTALAVAGRQGEGYTRALDEILKEARKLTQKVIGLCEEYRPIAKSNLVGQVDGLINNAKEMLSTGETKFESALAAGRKDMAVEVLRQLVAAMEKYKEDMDKQIEIAKERVTYEKIQRDLARSRSSW